MAEAIRFSDFYPVKDDKQQPQIQSLPIEQIKTSPNQSRRYLYDTSLDSLVKSIREVGVLQPITVRKMGEAQYELVCGERRLRAARLAGQTTIPAILRSANDGKSALLALTENLQRQDLHFLEEAAGIQSLIQEYGLTQEEAARKLGKSQSAISNKLRLLRLSEPVKKMILTHHLTERHARALLRIPQEQQMLEVVHRVVVEELNVKKNRRIGIPGHGRPTRPVGAKP